MQNFSAIRISHNVVLAYVGKRICLLDPYPGDGRLNVRRGDVDSMISALACISMNPAFVELHTVHAGVFREVHALLWVLGGAYYCGSDFRMLDEVLV